MRDKEGKFLKGGTPWNKKYPDFWVCKFCSKEFLNKGDIRQFCSRECANKAKEGKHNSPATEFLKGRKVLPFEHTAETRRRISLAKKGKRCGKEHHNWKGGTATDKEYHLKWGRKNRDKCRAYEARYRDRNREKVRLKNLVQCHRRRAAGVLTKRTIQMVYEDNIKQYDTLTCYLCLKPIRFGNDSLEHKIPVSRGGTNNYDNLAIAHKRCNSKKGNKLEGGTKIAANCN